MWYRGDRNGNNELIPGAYWRPDYSENDPWIDFQQGAPAYLEKEPNDEWEWYFLAQHYGLPTRLLDWTESPIAALYFALHEWDAKTAPAVWVLEPAEFNRLSVNFPYVPSPTLDNLTSIWLPSKLESTTEWSSPVSNEIFRNEYPLAIYPRRANARIAAQRGTFTIHGGSRCSIEALVKSNTSGHPDADGVLAKINLIGTDADQARRDLLALGIRHSALFPELEYYVRELKEYHRCL